MANQKNDLIPMMQEWFDKAPKLPANICDIFVKIAPILSLIFGVLGVIGGLGVIGFSPLAALGGFHSAANIFISGLLVIASSVLLLIAYPGLNKRKMTG